MGWQLRHKMELSGERELTIQHVVQAVICTLQTGSFKTLCNAPHARVGFFTQLKLLTHSFRSLPQ